MGQIAKPATVRKGPRKPPGSLRRWKPTTKSTSDRKAEQDLAAGGRGRREVSIDGEVVATASVALKCFNPEYVRVYAYLRWFAEGRTTTVYVGPVDGTTRAEALAKAWRLAHKRGLLRQSGSHVRGSSRRGRRGRRSASG